MEEKVFLGQTLICVILLLAQIHGYNSCIQKERKALLELKQYLISISEEWALDSVLPTWTNDAKRNCCRWEGIKCNRPGGRVIGISISETNFKELSTLNLSLLHPFEEVRSLNLSGMLNQFNGFFDDVEGYNSLRRLRKLEILDLSSNSFNNSIFPFLNAATSLTTLVIQSNFMNGSLPFKELKDLINLELLDLSENMFTGPMQVVEFAHMKKLKALDLTFNDFSSSMELQGKHNLTNLEVLGLGWNSFDGTIPIEVFCEMKNLLELDLSVNNFVGQLPPCLGSLNKLRFLDLSSNQLSGNIPSSFSSLQSLEYLSLADNNFTGLFSFSPLANLTKLKVLKLSSPFGMVEIEPESTWEPLFQLSVVVLPFCSLENIPSFLINQKNLHLVDLSNNKLSGDIPTWLLENNPDLKVLQLQNNSFTVFQISAIVHNLQVLDFSDNDISGVFPDNIGNFLPSLLHLNGSDNLFQGNFPSSMGEMKNISFLDLSYNNFSGELPRSFVTGCFSLEFLKLSHNKFSGQFLPRRTSFTALSVLMINNNSFTGKIGVGLLSSINLGVLDMSNNFLTGTIPPSLLVIPFLSLVDLSGNLLSGALPLHIRNIDGTRLFLQDNNFTGKIPDTLLGSVNILDLRNNKLFGSIPEFVDTGDISILLLRGNNLTGSIPNKLCELSNIRLLDLSDNKLNGFIPSCLSNLSFALGGDEGRSQFAAGISTVANLQLEFYKSTFVVDNLSSQLEHLILCMGWICQAMN
ncbi:LOW QUALITY PROTEIN: receptor-like protein 56 [Raphanus sativus]|uniref:LOW QUALITY PROTEIN: receptor-like protein 56 n=1 Tax=Raphanus sativus TaxID=3726 RepID=A0A6J0JS60_RAPSA|nr:LOW QUALITY PROTEIN: receptor-like protein 56 [Raphanus sativus]